MIGSVFSASSQSGLVYPFNYCCCFVIMGLFLIVSFMMKMMIPDRIYNPKLAEEKELSLIKA